MRIQAIVLFLILGIFSAVAQDVEDTTRKVYTTQRINGTPPTIDGLMDEPVWDLAEWGGGLHTESTL